MSTNADNNTACPIDSDKNSNDDRNSGARGLNTSDETSEDCPSKKPTRKVTFPADDQLVTQYFEPANPWHDVPTKTRAQLAAEYLESCRKHNTAAIESVLEQIRELPENCIGGGTRATRLALSECRLLGSAPADALEALLRRVQFRRIEIDNAELDDEGAEAIFDMVEYYESATTVCIGGPRQFGIRGWQAASRMVKKSADLCELEVRESPMEPSHAPVLARALRATTCRLRTLCLHRTAVSGEPLLNLVIALKTNHSIRELRLGDNNLVASDALHIASLLRINSHIQLLDLSNNQIQDKGVGHVADALIEQSTHTPPSTVTSPVSPHHFPLIGGYEARGLAFLVLWNNQLTRNCAHHLNRALRVCVSLCVLNVGRNALGGEAVRALTRGATLISLGLQAVRLGPDAARPLADLIRADSTLQRLDLRENRLGSQSLQAILSAMKDNTTLTQIDLDDAADSTNLSVEDSEGATVARLTRDIRAACRRNEPAPAASPDRRAHRKISLTCQTSLNINRGMQGVEEMERRGGRLRSPAPSPAGSPIPAVQADRFSVNRVTPERESSTDSSSPSTPTRTYSPSQSRFKVVQVAEPVKVPVSPKFSPGETPKQSRFSVTRNYDSIYSLTPTQTQYLSQNDSQKNVQPKQESNDSSSQNVSVKIGESDTKAEFEDDVKTHVEISNDKKSPEDSKEKSKVNNEQTEKISDKQDELAKVDRVVGDVTKIIGAEIRIIECIPTHSSLEKDKKSNEVTNKIKCEDNIFKVKDSHENVDKTNAIRTSNVSNESSQVIDECGKMDEEPVTSVGSEFESNPILSNEDDNKQKIEDVVQTSPVMKDLSNITNALVCKPRLDIATYPLHSEFINLPMNDVEIRVIDNDNIGDTVINERVNEVNKNVSRTEANLIKSDINSDSVCKNVNSEIRNNVNENEIVVNSERGVDVQCASTQTQKVDEHSIIGEEPMKQIEAITEDLGNLIQEMRDLTMKTAVLKAQNVIEIVNTNVPASYKESVVLKKNKSESSLDSPDLEVSRLMGRKFGSPFCDSSSSLEISGSSMESLSALESQNTLRPVIIQESVESDSELDRRKPVISTESSIESSSDVTPAGQMLNTSVSSNDSVSPLFGNNKKIHGSLSSLEASVSSIESKTEKVMVTSADSGIEYSLQNPSEGRDDSSNEGTLTNNSSLRDNVKRNFQDTSSPKRTSSLLDVPALKTKGLDRMRKISWVAPSASFYLTKPEEKVESKLPSHLDKLLSLFQHPTSLFSRSNSQNDDERRSASNTPPRKDSSLTSSFWSWGSSDKVEKDDSLSEDSTLSERVQVSFVDESFSKKLDSKTPSTDTDTLSEFQVTSDTGTTDVIVQNLVLSNAKRDTDLNKPNDLNILPADEENSTIKDNIPEAKEIKQKTFAAVLKASGSENSLEKQSSPEGQPVDKLSSKVIRGIKENISPENTMTESLSTSLALELSEKQKKEMETDKNSLKHDEVKVQDNLAPIATIEETLDESLDIKMEKEECNIDLGKEALSLIDNNQAHETRSSLAEELKQAEIKEKMLDLSPELIIDEAVEVPEMFTAKEMKGLRSSPVIPERAKLKKSNSLEDLSARLQSLDIIDKEVTKKIAFKVPESATTPRDIPERRSKLRARTGSSPKSLPESLNKPCSFSKMDSIVSKKKKKVSSLGKIAKDSLLALNMSEDEIADFRKSYKLTSVESLRSLESVSEDATSNSVDSRCRSCLRTSQESLMSLDSINEDCRCSDNEKAGHSAR